MFQSTLPLRELVARDLPKLPSVTGIAGPVTARTLEEFLYALLWVILLVTGFTGWGKIAAKLSRVGDLPGPIACALGIAITIVLGGMLNLAHAIYPAVLVSFTAMGILLYFFLRHQRPCGHSWKNLWSRTAGWSRVILAIAILIFVMRAAATVGMARFDVSDDSSAYLVFPQKMLSAHTLATDPFSERRITSGLGGAYFLQCLIISSTPLSHLAMADRTVGLLLLAAILLELGLTFELSPFQIILLEFVVSLVPQETFNLTFVILPVSLFLAVVWMVWSASKGPADGRLRYALLAGILAGSVISLKSTYLPAAAAFVVIPFIFLFAPSNLKLAAQLSAMSFLGGVVCLAGWMVSMKLTSDTYLFPLLGRGLDYSRLHLFTLASRFSTGRSIVKVFLQAAALTTLGGLQLIVKPMSRHGRFNLGILTSAAIAITALNYETGADSIWRYNFPQFFTAIIVFYLAIASIDSRMPSRRTHLVFSSAALALMAMLFYYDVSGKRPQPFRELKLEAMNYKDDLASSLTARSLSSSLLQARYSAIEAALPKASISLESVAYPFLFNYANRSIYVMDWPGASGPYPGWPFGHNSTQVAQYLTTNRIQYVIYDYGYAVQSGAIVCQLLADPGKYSTWLGQQLRMTILVNSQLNDLKLHYGSIYDDGHMVILDLMDPIKTTPSLQAAWNVNTNLNTVCAPIAQRFLADSPTGSHNN